MIIRRLMLIVTLLMGLCLSANAQYVTEKPVKEKVHVLDFGFGVGWGYYMGDTYGGQRENYFDFTPVNEMFGFSLGYRMNEHWSVMMQGYRQRIAFWDGYKTGDGFKRSKMFYSPLWNVDASVEYNFLKFAPRAVRIKDGSLTPYVSLGVGASVFDTVANPRWLTVDGKKKGQNPYPMIKTASMDLGAYVFGGVGIKWHIVDGWQLKGSIAYQLHLGKDRRGITEGYVSQLSTERSANLAMSLSVVYALTSEEVKGMGYRYNWFNNLFMWSDRHKHTVAKTKRKSYKKNRFNWCE